MEAKKSSEKPLNAAHPQGLRIPSRRKGSEARTLVLVDMVPYTREAEIIVHPARGIGVDVVVITDELNSRAQIYMPYIFHASTKAGAFLESTEPLATLLNLVKHAVARRDPEKAAQRISSWPSVLRDLGLY